MKALMAFLLIASTPSVWAIETVCKHSVETGRDSVRTNSPVFSDSHDGEATKSADTFRITLPNQNFCGPRPNGFTNFRRPMTPSGF